jgi:hypothetical protein
MRRSMSLAVLLISLSALPAVAGHGGGAHVSSGSRPHVVRHFNHFHHFNRFNRFTDFNGFIGFNTFGLSGFNTFGLSGFNQFGRSRFFTPFGQDWASGWAWADWDNWGGGPAVGAAPGTTVLVGAAPAQSAPPPPAKATVDTEAGVTVFRGPGSHHLARY